MPMAPCASAGRKSIEHLRRAVFETQTFQAREREQHRIHFAGIELGKPRIDIAAQAARSRDRAAHARPARGGAPNWCRARAPCGRSASVFALFETNASRGSSRGRSAAIESPAGRSTGTSFIECTARSMASFSSASSSSLTNRPLPPASASGRSWMRSPVVLTVTISHAAPFARSRSAHHVGLNQGELRAAGADARERFFVLRHDRVRARTPLNLSQGNAPLRDLTVLGIETSCDETAASVVRGRAPGPGTILSNIVFCAARRAPPLWRRGAGDRGARPCRTAGRHRRGGAGRRRI